MQGSRIDGYWKIDGSRDLSVSWTGFTQFTLLEAKPPDGYMWSGERLTKRQATSRPDHLWPENWKRDANSGKSVLMHTAGVMYSLAKVSKEWLQKCCGCDEGYTIIGLRISGDGAVEIFIDFSEALKHTEANPMCSIH